MQKDTDILGGWDEAELVELSEADVHGGSTATCAIGIISITTAISAAICPTTACSVRR